MLDRAKIILRIAFWLYAGLFLWGWLREWVNPMLAILPFLLCIVFLMLRRRASSGQWMEGGLSVLLSLMHVQYCIAQPLWIRGESMQPALNPGIIVWVNKLSNGLIAPPVTPAMRSHGFHRLARWNAMQKSSIVVIRFPGLNDGADAVIVKRVAALPGETFEFANSQILVNNHAITVNGVPAFVSIQPRTIQPPVFQLPEEVEKLGSLAIWAAGNGLPIRGVVPEGAVIVLGDHTLESRDSRSFGFVPIDFIMGSISSPQTESVELKR
ncbi:MAG: signal peptidase I [Spirochaetia bacterium]|nr:signal peptidase I [Spirochaetia bacterium]